MNMLQVQAAPGLQVPMEDKPRIYITDAEFVAVPDSAYYQRRLADGDLMLQGEEDAALAPPAADAGGDQAVAPTSKKASKVASTNPTGA